MALPGVLLATQQLGAFRKYAAALIDRAFLLRRSVKNEEYGEVLGIFQM
jgi:hypothetical protein